MTTVRGMKDLLPPESFLWSEVIRRMRGHFSGRGYQEIRTPILEKSELFLRSIGETTDIVEKEMYTFTDKSGDSVTMRPEGTAPVVRAFLQNRGLFKDLPVRLFYTGPMFRHERPQKGRLRQFHQVGAELLGSEEPYVDAEVLMTLFDLFSDLSLEEIHLEVNSLGCPECRPVYNKLLLGFISSNISGICEECERRYERNPLRILDCKSPSCAALTQEAPSILDSLCPECSSHFEEVVRVLGGNRIPYHVNSRMVRGLDYYQKTTFEFLSPRLGSQNAVAAGGRYDGLAEMIGAGQRVPGVGFAIGLERLISLLSPDTLKRPGRIQVFLALQKREFRDRAFSLKRMFEISGISCDMDYSVKSLKSQMRRANRQKAVFTVIFGEAEMADERVIVKEMGAGKEEEISIEDVVSRVKENL